MLVDLHCDGKVDADNVLEIAKGGSASYCVKLSKAPINIGDEPGWEWWVTVAIDCDGYGEGACIGEDGQGNSIDVIKLVPSYGRAFKGDWGTWKNFTIDADDHAPNSMFTFSHHVWDNEAGCPDVPANPVRVRVVDTTGGGGDGNGDGNGNGDGSGNGDGNFDGSNDGGGNSNLRADPRASSARSGPGAQRTVPALEIADAQEGDTAEFVVTLHPPSTQVVAVSNSTQAVTATAKLDYEPVSGTLRFGPGGTSGTIRVPIRKDTLEERTEKFAVRLSRSSGATIRDGKAIGWIPGDMERRIEFVNRKVLPDIGRALAFSAVRCRIGRAFSNRVRRAEALVGGLSLLPLPGPPRRPAATGFEPRTLERMPRIWSFLVPSEADPGGGGRFMAWGCGDYLSLDGGSGGGAVAWDGGVVSMELGADITLGPSLLAGMSVTRSKGSFDYRSKGKGERSRGEHDLRLTGVHPYFGWSISPNLDVWGTVGRASGDLRVSDDIARRSVARSVTVDSGTVGVIGRLPPRGTTKFNLKGEAGLARLSLAGTEAAIGEVKLGLSRLRLSTEASRERELSSGASLVPWGEVGVRYDGGDGETGVGLEIGNGLRYRNPHTGWTAQSHSRWLATHENDSLREWSYGARLHYEPDASGRGPSVRVTRSWGETASGVQRIWERDATDAAPSGDAPAGRLDVRVAYGFPAFSGQRRLTPYGAVGLEDGAGRDYRLGGRLSLGAKGALSLEAEHRDAAPSHAVMLRFVARF